MQEISENYIVSLDICLQHQHGRHLGTEKVIKKGESRSEHR